MSPVVSSLSYRKMKDRQRKAGKEDCIQMALIYLLPGIIYSSQFPIFNMEAIILQSFKGDFFLNLYLYVLGPCKLRRKYAIGIMIIKYI